MNEDYLEPGVYAINQRAGFASLSIFLEKIIVHNEAFVILYHIKPKTDFIRGLDIRKDQKNVDSISYYSYSGNPSYVIGFGKLPSPPLDICFDRSRFDRAHTRKILFRLKDFKPLTEAPEIVYRSIAVDNFFYPDSDEKKIYIKRVITGQFTPQCSYTIIEGDFQEIESEIIKSPWFVAHDGRFFYLICRSDSWPEIRYSFEYNTALSALFSDTRFIPYECSVTGCRLQTIEEASRSSAINTVLADPPVVPGEPFRAYARNWPPWNKPKPATIYEAIRYNDLKAIKSLLKNNPELLNKGNAEGYTPLEFAAAYGTEKIVAYLISQGADINAKDNYGSNPLRHARNSKIADLLRKHGAKE